MTYYMSWPQKCMVDGGTPAEMAHCLIALAETVEQMDKTGVLLTEKVRDGWAHFTTDDPEVAKKYGFEHHNEESGNLEVFNSDTQMWEVVGPL